MEEEDSQIRKVSLLALAGSRAFTIFFISGHLRPKNKVGKSPSLVQKLMRNSGFF